jgi:alpha-glucosidase
MANSLLLLLRGIQTLGLGPTWNGVAHAIRTRWVEAKFADPQHPLRGLPLLAAFLRRLPVPPGAFPPPGPVVATPGPLLSVRQEENALHCQFAHASLTVQALAPDRIRVSWRAAALTPTPGPSGHPLPLSRFAGEGEGDRGVGVRALPELRTPLLRCQVSPDGRIILATTSGDVIAEEAAPVAWAIRNPARSEPRSEAEWRTPSAAEWHPSCALLRWRVSPDAHFYGLGERAAPLDLRGRVYVNWNTDPRTYDPGDDPLYLCVPFLIVLPPDGRHAWGLLLENSARSRSDLGQTDPEMLCAEVEVYSCPHPYPPAPLPLSRSAGEGEGEAAGGGGGGGEVSYSLFYAPTVAGLLERFTEVTGRHPLFPRWALGYHQCRWSYYPEERVRRLARDFRETYRVPCDGIHLDIHYMDGYRVFTWDRRRFPDPKRLMADLHGQGFKVVTIIDPGVKADRKYRVFQDGLARGMFCRYPDGRVFIGPVWPGNCAFPDFTDPRVREWWGDLHRDLVEAGVDGIWDDMNEPALFGEDDATIPGPVRHDLDGAGGDHRVAHNLYGLNMARATAEGLARLAPDRRPFVITRSGWTGIQRYAAHWTADNRSDWASLRQTLPMVLNLGLSGIAFTGSDIGGFEGFATGELFTRWLQMSVFFPFCRAHTYLFSPDQEPWSWGEPYLSINREFIRLRYRLLPYLYTALWQCTQTGAPIVRPLLWAFQDDPTTHTLDDEFLCGDALVVAPVLEEGATRRQVYLPAGLWYDFWTDERHEGPTWLEVEAPLERIPVFVRAGAVVPTGPEMDYVGQRPTDPLTLHLYLPAEGQEGVSFLYEDDGETLAYRQGEYRLHRFVLRGDGRQVDLTWTVEGAFDPGPRRVEALVHRGGGREPARLEGVAPGRRTTDLPARR